ELDVEIGHRVPDVPGAPEALADHEYFGIGTQQVREPVADRDAIAARDGLSAHGGSRRTSDGPPRGPADKAPTLREPPPASRALPPATPPPTRRTRRSHPAPRIRRDAPARSAPRSSSAGAARCAGGSRTDCSRRQRSRAASAWPPGSSLRENRLLPSPRHRRTTPPAPHCPPASPQDRRRPPWESSCSRSARYRAARAPERRD